MTSRYHRGAALLLAAVPLLALTACSGASHASPAPPPATKHTAQRGTAPAEPDLHEAARPALALVGEWIPEDFTDAPTSSGYFWASAPATGVDDRAPGRHLLQIACSGNGGIVVQMTAHAPYKKVTCGDKATGFPYTGAISAYVGGAAANRGIVAWRILNAT
ncbi:hypothetical protein [Actinacidiphila paucisporea]|uniref:Lipoprotein n=1 Tax=Actinacidiphila paucisporea TaxID=310782 RepID=A0A1M6YUM0_9ACTN|nr:hypothetical protein [Actinacidiphila paucisporea]SHL21772.1 hypothetical protein SAMN05216499_103123 [Actinacidiphila paucisporea]